MSDRQFSSGDRVRHANRPEWGIGTVLKAEQLPANGHAAQRLSIRFPNAGIKTLVTGHAELERIEDKADPFSGFGSPTVHDWVKLNGNDWLAPMAQRKIEEALLSLPQDVRDPFNSLQKRLTLTLGLYRFDRSGRGIIDWAVAQTGLDDPLSRFTRQELEQRFERWTHERDNHLAKLLQEVRNEPAILAAALKNAPPAAQQAVRRLTAAR